MSGPCKLDGCGVRCEMPKRLVSFLEGGGEVVENLLETMGEVMRMLADNAQRCVAAGADAQKTSEVSAQLDAMRREMKEHTASAIEAGMGRIGVAVAAIGDQTDKRMLATMATVQTAVGDAMGKLDAEAFGRAVHRR